MKKTKVTFEDDRKPSPSAVGRAAVPAARNSAVDNNVDHDHDNDHGNRSSDPGHPDGAPSIWENDGWELTWPIWHMLPRDEKKTIAQRHGCATIGAFEENMALQKALDQTENGTVKRNVPSAVVPVGTQSISSSSPSRDSNKHNISGTSTELTSADDNANTAKLQRSNTEPTLEDGSESEDGLDQDSSEAAEELTGEQAVELAGTIMVLHEELLHLVFSYLPVDMFGTLALVSPHWKYVTRTESVYKRLCERLYLNQSKRKQLHVSRFGNSYRRMLEVRPRVRTAGGCYVLKYARVKQIQRDMWTEIPLGAILETIYYRYMYFQEDGRVLYALTSTAPNLMIPRLLRVCLHRVRDPAAVWGSYQVQKNNLTVVAKQEWTHVKFELTIQQKSQYGTWGTLVLNKHLTSASASFDYWSHDLVTYDVPVEEFRFVRSAKL